MLHNEARELLVEAYERSHDAKGTASAYGVSVPTVYRLAEQKQRRGAWLCESVGVGASSRELSAIAQAIERQPDITLAELIERLDLKAGIETVRRAIQAMGYRRKKKMIHASEQERPRCTGQEERMEWVRRSNEGKASGISG